MITVGLTGLRCESSTVLAYRIIRCGHPGLSFLEFLNRSTGENTVRITWVITFGCAAAIVSAQQPVAKGFSSAADVQGMIEKAKNERKSDQPNFIQPILQAAPYSVNLEYRVEGIDTNPNIHDVEAEMVYVVDGAGVLTIGGKLKD